MKHVLMFLIAAAAALSANAADCMVYIKASDKAVKLMQRAGAWEFSNYNVVCEKLRRANAEIRVVSGTAVLVGTSVGWAHVSAKDKNAAIVTSEFGNSSTIVNTYASQDKADELLWLAMNQAIESWTGLDKALASLEQERNKIKRAGGR